MTDNHLPFKNPNLRVAALFVDGLAQSGLTAVIISPGSRSTPLTLAFEAHPAIEIFLHLDERGAGFFALGMAIASDKPVALVCTSGTAVANYLPAIIEAQMSQVPLLILTGDRPHELRHSGANQTIDQVKIFGDQVLWFTDMALPEAVAPQVALRNVQTTAVRAYATANGLRKGPVHVNFPFRKPLEPEASGEWQVASQELFTIHHLQSTIQIWKRGKLLPTPEQMEWLTAVFNQHPHGLIICGPRCPGDDFAKAVINLAQQTGYPILADAISGLRFHHRDAKNAAEKSAKFADSFIISSYETFLQSDPGWPEPGIIVRFGAVPTSKWLNSYLDGINPKIRLHIRENGVWADDSQRISHFLQVNETAVCQQLLSKLAKRQNEQWITAVNQSDKACWTHLQAALADSYFDGAIVADVIELIPEGATLFMGNSSPIRHLEQYGRFQSKQLTAYANRGASGIDGNLATALGMYAASKRPLVAIVGDITFFHDMNSLYLAKGDSKNITIILLHNDGGSIFNRLPIAQIEPPFTKLFLTPHGLDFEPVCRMFGLDYVRTDSRKAFRAAFTASVQDNTPRVIVVHTNNQEDDAIRREINQFVKAQIKA